MKEVDFSLQALLARHPRVALGGAMALVAIVTWPIIDYAWHHWVLGF